MLASFCLLVKSVPFLILLEFVLQMRIGELDSTLRRDKLGGVFDPLLWEKSMLPAVFILIDDPIFSSLLPVDT